MHIHLCIDTRASTPYIWIPAMCRDLYRQVKCCQVAIYCLWLYYFQFGRRGIRVPSACSIGDPQVNVCFALWLGRFFLREIARLSLRPCREGHRSFPFQRRQRHPVLFEFGVCWTGDRPPVFVQFRSTHRTQRWALFVFAFAWCLFVCIIFVWWLPYLEALVGDVVADPLSALLIDVCLVAQEPSQH